MSVKVDAKNTPAILTDITKCIGCRECVSACKTVNNTEPDKPRRWALEDGLSSRNWTSVIDKEKGYVRKQCRHCLEPACVSVCPVGALHTTKEGPVVYDSDKCLGCRYCMMACAYGIPRYDWDQVVPYVRKCIMCADRLKEGKEPACTAACPVDATIFGTREELLKEAHRRIEENPDKYDNRVWGEHQLGGTRVLYLAPKGMDLTFLTYGQQVQEKPLPATTRTAMHAVPFAFVGMGGAMAGIHWLVKRRQKLQGEHQQHGQPPQTPDEGGEEKS
jgi:formate dehydrogenase iron-sulfur subunit